MPIKRFIEWYPRYRDVFKEDVFEEVYNFLSRPENIWAMARACEEGKPALNGVVKELEKAFQERFDFDNPVNRRLVGSMIKEILHDFGFRRKGQRLVSNSNYFSTASYYQLEEDKAENTVSGLFEVKGRVEQEEGAETRSKVVYKKPEGHTYFEKDRDVEKELDNLLQVIDDENVSQIEKNKAIERLGAIGVTALEGVPRLLNALHNERLAATTLKALTGIARKAFDFRGAAGIILDLTLLLQDEIPERRYMAAKALGEIGAPGATEAARDLTEALRDEDERVRKGAAWALYKIGHPAFKEASDALVEAMEDEDEGVRIAAARAIGACAPLSVDVLLKLLEHEESHVSVRAAYELGRAGEYARVDAAPGLIRALSQKNSTLRGATAWALGSIEETTQETVEALLEALKDDEDEVREKAAWALGRIGVKTDVDPEPLIKTMKDENKNVRKAALWALGNIKTYSARDPIPFIMESFQEKDKYLREKAVWAIGKIGANSSRGKTAVPLLIETLHDEDWGVRKAAAQALGRIGPFGKNALSRLSKMEKDRKEKDVVKNMARWAVEEIGKYSK